LEEVLRKTPAPDNLKPYNQAQNMLFPPNVRDLLDDDHLCLVINDVVNALDLGCLYKKVSSRGRPLYHPAMMLKILFYAYAVGIFSSRKIAKALCEQIPFIFLAAWQKPDFRTISDFRKNNLNALRKLFTQIVAICEKLGMVSVGHIAIDGTKIKANASDANTYDTKRIEREIQKMLEAADRQDAKEDQTFGPENSGDELPESIQKPAERLEKLKQIQIELENSGKEKINATDPDA
jgi:transposase